MSEATPRVNPELQMQYNTFKATLQQLSQKIGELENDREEHRLVLDTLKQVSSDRRCFRMVGGVLIERTVKDVIPVLDTNHAGLGQVLDTLARDYRATQEEMSRWQKKNKVQIVQT